MHCRPHLGRKVAKNEQDGGNKRDSYEKIPMKPGLYNIARVSYAVLCPLCIRNNNKKRADISMYFMLEFVVVVRNE